ncbi:MAG: hypothetical protein RBS34_15430 [Desulfofustis sp.]|jgi:hypothetical protein|nr:hypothetical protein [Desulfofustis sp.]
MNDKKQRTETHLLARAFNPNETVDAAVVVFNGGRITLEIIRQDRPSIVLDMTDMPGKYVDMTLDVTPDLWALIFALLNGLQMDIMDSLAKRGMISFSQLLDQTKEVIN